MGDLKTMSTDEAARMVTAVERAIGYAGTLGADAGIAKAAAEEKYGDAHVERMVQLYNTSRTMSHFASSPVEKRAASFELADAANVSKLIRDSLAPGVVEKAASVSETRLRDFARVTIEIEHAEKSASVVEHLGRLSDLSNHAHQKLDAARRKSAATGLEIAKLEERVNDFLSAAGEKIEAMQQSVSGGILLGKDRSWVRGGIRVVGGRKVFYHAAG